jgi:hypothetical protein
VNTIAHKYGASSLPGVNLLPLEVARRKAMRVVAAVAAIAVLGVIVVVGLGYAGVLAVKSVASSDRSSAAAAELDAVAARDGKRPTYEAVVKREAAEYALAQIGLGEADYAQLSGAVEATADANTSFDSITLSGPNALELGGTEPEGEIYGSGIGSVQFKARAVSMETATALIARIEAIPGIANVRSTAEQYSVNGSDVYYTIDGRGSLTTKVLTMRLVPTSGLTDVNALLSPKLAGPSAPPSAKPSPAPSPAPSATAAKKG